MKSATKEFIWFAGLSCLVESRKPEQPNRLNRPEKPEALRLEVPCLDHILEAVDVEPVTCRVEHADRIVSLQQFLKQLGDAGFAVAGLASISTRMSVMSLAAPGEILRNPIHTPWMDSFGTLFPNCLR